MDIDDDMDLIEAEKMSNIKQTSKTTSNKISNVENVENKKPPVKHSLVEEKPKPVAPIIKDEPKETEVKKPKLNEETNRQAPPAPAPAATKRADPKKPAKPANQSTLTNFFKKA